MTASLFGLLAIGAIGIGFAPHSAPGLLGLGKKLLAVAAPHALSRAQEGGSATSNKSGSSKPPPKGTATPILAGAQGGAVQVHSEGCVVFPSGHPGLAASSVPELRKLAQYEQLCGGALADRSSFFTSIPPTVSEAYDSAHAIASTLKAYSQVGVTPLVFLEPGTLDLAQLAGGAYDTILRAYYGTLQASGITSDMMGMWVIIPEGNLPQWSTVDPTIYAAAVTKTAQFQKEYFPLSQASIMLDSESYPVGGTWGDGRFVSLVPYVQGIPRGLIDSFGLQGFPWAGPASQPDNTFYSPSAYLRVDFAVEAAHALGVNGIWVNTGTFNQMYTNQPSQTVTLSPSQRQAMLNGVLQEVKQVKAQGFSVAIHLFAQNKSKVSEATDWSYWQGQPDNSASTAVFTTFAHDAAAAGVPLWLYDADL
ncbi:MAG TPA: hypothetical protein VLF69_00560 [Candidatus Saccharimonadales bacterium]|nr:hypothetical protein [Candidatus Saccharimonadales bacterium]